MNRDLIKMVGILAMTVNHIALIFLSPDVPLYSVLVNIGYFTAITMCFFLVEGFYYTKDRKRYGMRLFLFALISEIPFQLAFSGKIQGFMQNMIATLFICYLILVLWHQNWDPTIKMIGIGVLTLLTYKSDWGLLAPMFTVLFVKAYGTGEKMSRAFGAGIVLFGCWEFLNLRSIGMEIFAACTQALFACTGPIAAAVILLCFYNGQRAEKGRSFYQYFFYIYYPAHLLLLFLLSKSAFV